MTKEKLRVFIAGIVSGLLGIGSGALKVIAMDRIMRVPFKVSTTTSNFMIGVTAAASAGVYLHRHRKAWIDISAFKLSPQRQRKVNYSIRIAAIDQYSDCPDHLLNHWFYQGTRSTICFDYPNCSCYDYGGVVLNPSAINPWR